MWERNGENTMTQTAMCQFYCFCNTLVVFCEFRHLFFIQWCHVYAQLTWRRIKKSDNNNNNKFILAMLAHLVFNFLIFTIKLIYMSIDSACHMVTIVRVNDNCTQQWKLVSNSNGSLLGFRFYLCGQHLGFCVSNVFGYIFRNVCQLASVTTGPILIFADVSHRSTHFAIPFIWIYTQQKDNHLDVHVSGVLVWRKSSSFYVVQALLFFSRSLVAE